MTKAGPPGAGAPDDPRKETEMGAEADATYEEELAIWLALAQLDDSNADLAKAAFSAGWTARAKYIEDLEDL
jgi:hypothetical protein